MASQALTYALLANPKLLETGYNAAKGTAVTLGKILFYGALGFGTYKALSKLIDSAAVKQQTKRAIANTNDRAYKAALLFTSYFQANDIDKNAIIDLLEKVHKYGDYNAVAGYYMQINFGKKWKADCNWFGFDCKEFDISGNFVQHLKTALGNEYFPQAVQYLGYIGNR